MKRINLSIPTPCHEDWDNMTPQQQGRFCGSCQKTVVDFTKMTDQQVLNYFSKMHGGNTCGRFVTEQLNRDIVLHKKRTIPWFKYFLNMMIPAMIASKSYSQGRVYKKQEVICSPAKVNALAVIKGDTIMVQQNNVMKDKFLDYKILQPEPGVLGEVLVVGYARPKAKPSIFHQFKNAVRDSLRALPVRVYPNPIRHGNSINIEYKGKRSGNYELTIADMNGKIVQSNKFTSKTSLLQENFNLNGAIIPGSYVMILINEKGKRIWEKKIIVQ